MSDNKIKTAEEIRAVIAHLPGKKVVFTNGCFDLIHIGHVRLFQKAKSYGDILIVGVNSDDSVRRLKGPSRPIVPERDRAEVVAAMAAVDYVVLFSEDTPVELIGRIQPHIHVKGGDYKPEDLPESAVIQAYGGKIEIFRFVEGRSSTNIMERISASLDRRT